jgi:drug/metabolite transporter (DMT)-like permease
VGRALVGQFPPLALSFLRWALAFAVIAPFTLPLLWRQRAVLRAWAGPLLAISAVGVAAYNSLQYLALQTSSVLSVTLIAASGPVITLLVGAAAFGARVSRVQWLGAAVSLAGVLTVVTRGEPTRLAGLQLAAGDLIMLAATLCWSVYTWLLRDRRPPLALAPFLTVQIGLGALMILPFAWAEAAYTGARIAWGWPTLGGLVYVALLPSLAAYWAWDRGVARAGPLLPMQFANLTPLFAAALAYALLAEPIVWYHVLGAVLIVGGILVANRPVPGAKLA